ncbi:MAG: PAS domain S-box protein, partial [Phycisphaerae bacterium]|nr:PAS domain S-box protein [Phycisphaerae bacterium]
MPGLSPRRARVAHSVRLATACGGASVALGVASLAAWTFGLCPRAVDWTCAFIAPALAIGLIVCGLLIARQHRVALRSLRQVEAGRRHAQREAESLARLEAENPNPVLRVGPAGRVLYANQAARRALPVAWGIGAGEALPDELVRLSLRALEGGEPIEAEIRAGHSTFLVTFAPIEQGPYVNLYTRDITDRRRAEKAMHDSYRLLQAIIGGTDDLVFVKDRNGRYLMANRAACRELGRDLEELVGRDDRALLPPADADELQAADREVLEQGRNVVREEAVTRGATTRTFLSTKGPIRNNRGQIVGLYGISRDITDRKDAEEEILDANRCLKAMTECRQALMHATSEPEMLHEVCRIIVGVAGYRLAWVGFAEDDADRTVRPAAVAGRENGYVSQAKITWADTPRGQGPTGSAIRTGLSVIVDDIATDPKFAPWREAALARGYASSITVPLLADAPASADRPDRRAFGAINICSHRARAFDAAEVQLLTELAADLSFGVTSLRARLDRQRAEDAREMAEQALRQSEEKYRELVENANSIILKMDRQGNLIFINEFAQKFFGYRQEEILGRNVVGTIVPEVESSGRDLKSLIARITDRPGDYHINANENMTRDGRRVWVAWTNREIYDGRGELVGVLSIGNDMTETIRREQQLRQAQKLEAVGLLAGGVAHDFRNHLTVIRGYSEMMLHLSMVSGRAREYVQEILKATERSANLTNELLSFSRKQILRPEVVNLNSILSDMAKSLTRLIGEDVRLTVATADDLRHAKVDVAQFQEAIVNLVVNSRDAMPTGGRLAIETGNVDLDEAFVSENVGASPGPHVMVAVRDTGCGMDADTAKQVFDPFFTTKPAGQGTGLGLAMVYGFLKQSNGHITVETRPGRGTTMRMYFPVVDAPTASQAVAPRIGRLSHGDGTVLVVEDEPAIRRMLVQTLQHCGYSVLSASSPRKALAMVKEY